MSLLVSAAPQSATASAMCRVVTVTPAPAVDRVYGVDRLLGGGHHRAVAARPELAGKGVRLSRTLAAAGGVTRAVLPLGPSDRQTLGLGENDVCVDVPWAVRTNVVVTDADGTTTNLNAEPQPLTADEWDALSFAALRSAVEIDAHWLVVAGSFPRLAGTDRLIDIVPIVRAAQELGIRVAVDSSGAGLRSVLDPTVRIDLVKPNRAELADLVGAPIDTIADAIAAAQEVRATGVRRVVVSLGEDGALSVGDTVLWAPAPAITVVNTTGAGDAMLAGYLSAAHSEERVALVDALRRGVAWGTAAVRGLSPADADELAVPGVRSPEARRLLRRA